MTQEQVKQAFELCTENWPEDFCPCDNCPMMEAGCDYADLEYVTIPRALRDEIYKQLDPEKSEFTHVKYLN